LHESTGKLPLKAPSFVWKTPLRRRGKDTLLRPNLQQFSEIVSSRRRLFSRASEVAMMSAGETFHRMASSHVCNQFVIFNEPAKVTPNRELRQRRWLKDAPFGTL
jgi:hypothetical protein